MTLTPVERRLEDATVLYVKAQAWKASIGLFAELARIESDNANAWLGIGSALWRLSLDEPQLLEPSVAALKRSVRENERSLNKSPKQLLFNASQSASKAGLNPDAIAAFNGDPRHFAELVEFSPQMLIDATNTLDENSRMSLANLLVEVPGELFDALLSHLAENDASSNVRTAAQRALRERPQKPAVTPEGLPAVGASPETALDAAAEVSAVTPEPQVTMADTPAEDIVSALPTVTEVIPVTPSNEEERPSTEIPAIELPAAETPAEPAKPAPAKPADDEAIRAQLEARKQRLMGKK